MSTRRSGRTSAIERVETAFSRPWISGSELPDAPDALVDVLSAHLAHEHQDALPLIGQVLTQKERAPS
jgi:hypothetical protein